ncbi:MAG TPA: 2-phospho-L-lactate transferase [Anaerolineae bacterium]|nr:MAG: 2-phospho-L-lactate transferase [Anaerolineae bacterium SM23_ 63]HEY43011.1 2-phospho-L-lactate transferase [Anaerolineae bacterium]
MALRVVALAGGVGGSKLAHGLAEILPPDHLTVIVNTGDDFEHLGLTICPDLDTMIYTLAGLANPQTGWGRKDETWGFLETIETLGGPTWFQLGDRDLALHHERSRRLKEGQSLTEVTQHVCQTLGISITLLPMSDDPVRTIVITDKGELAFQNYFVARRCAPCVRGFRFTGVETAIPAPGVIQALSKADLVVLCPSNPWVSLDPILAVKGIRDAVSEKSVVGVSPIVGGKAIKGPAAKMYSELGFRPSSLSVAEHFQDLLAGMVIDKKDQHLASDIQALNIRVLVTNTIMKNEQDRMGLGEEVLAFASAMMV